MTLPGNYRIFVISLPDSPRRKQVIREFAKHKVEFEFVDAIRGNSLDLYNDRRIDAKRLTEIGMIKIPGNVGAALSHIKCQRKILEEDLDFAFILEDDMLLKAEFKSLLPSVISASTRQGVTLLFYQCFREIVLAKSRSVKIGERHSIYEYTGDKAIFSAAAYIVWKETAKKIADYLSPVCASPDAWNLFKKDGVLKDIRVVYPMLCSHALSPSEMSYPVKGHIKKTLHPVTKKLKNVRLPFVQNLLKAWRYRMIKSQQKVKILQE